MDLLVAENSTIAVRITAFAMLMMPVWTVTSEI